MPIKVTCTCGQSFKAKDELAGKRARCPKCSQPLLIPSPQADELTLEAPVERPRYNPLDDILNEEGVKAAVQGPMCPSCSEPVSPMAVICVQCGFNLQTGEKVVASVDEDDDEEMAMAGMSETQKMMYKAEREIEDMPISADGQKFGDEGDSYVIAIVGVIVMAVVVGLAIFMIIQLDKIEDFNTAYVSMVVSFIFARGAAISIIINAFRERPLEGWLVLFAPFYILWYSITRGLYVAFGVMILFEIIGTSCYMYLREAAV